ncbi:MAG: ribonuclease HII [Parachlamydia sp.]|nr:ribonuclease HII [Parachlamydia sp.]
MSLKIPIEEFERARLELMMTYEKDNFLKGYRCIAGIDEAGRGPLAGPVVAAACILPVDKIIPRVDDSKKLTPAIREELFLKITSDSSIVYGIGIVEPEEIDSINIYQATIQAMLQAVGNLSVSPDLLLVDGMALKNEIPSIKIIKGDQHSQSIAAASILAKVTRDRLMVEYHEIWPHYGFGRHKGYGTPEHLEALSTHGPCPKHRQSFEPVKNFYLAAASR